MSEKSFQIANWRGLTAHPLADTFRLMTPEEREKLALNVCDRGYDSVFPIVLYENQILDGRNRHAVCIELDVQPTFMEFEPTGNDTALDFVIRANLSRRHLTTGEREAIALELKPHFAAKLAAQKAAQAREQALQKPRDEESGTFSQIVAISPQSGEQAPEAPTCGTRARDLAAAAFGVKGRALQELEKVRKDAPELYAEVKAGRKTTYTASREARTRGKEEMKPKTSTTSELWTADDRRKERQREERLKLDREVREAKKWHDACTERERQKVAGVPVEKATEADPVPDHARTLFRYYDNETCARLVECVARQLPPEMRRALAERLLKD